MTKKHVSDHGLKIYTLRARVTTTMDVITEDTVFSIQSKQLYQVFKYSYLKKQRNMLFRKSSYPQSGPVHLLILIKENRTGNNP